MGSGFVFGGANEFIYSVWGLVVMPANVQINEWAATGITPSDWERWRMQWQAAQSIIFLFHLTGYSALLFSVIRETEEN